MSGSPKHQVSVSLLFSMTYTVRVQKDTRNLQRRYLPMPRNALGRGLGALIREPEAQVAATSPASPAAAAATAAAPARETIVAAPLSIDIDRIDPSPFQPRTRFREEALEELVRSVLASGIIQPLVLRPLKNR